MSTFKAVWPVVTFVILYTGLIFGGFNWMLSAKIDPINEKLGNHITDTNKKIDRLSEKVDRLSERFDKLYHHLLKEKDKK